MPMILSEQTISKILCKADWDLGNYINTTSKGLGYF